MFNLKKHAFLLGLFAGAALTALLGIFVLMLIQVTRPAPSPVPQPIESATVTPVSAPSDFPYSGFPVPVPTPVKAAYSGQDLGYGVYLEDMTFKGSKYPNGVEVSPGEEIEMYIYYGVWNTDGPVPGDEDTSECDPTCNVVLTIGMVNSDGGFEPLACFYNGTPGPTEEEGDWNPWQTTITAPTAPGVYGLRLDYHRANSCEEAVQDITPDRPAMTLATFEVMP